MSLALKVETLNFQNYKLNNSAQKGVEQHIKNSCGN